ncbi:MAG TPA: hypothetical protein VEK38_04475 [Candidatus Bathyarchaeia archaeon]|nr:hypothetical protein [Candidatus Bathyarchaeia archaeon]
MKVAKRMCVLCICIVMNSVYAPPKRKLTQKNETVPIKKPKLTDEQIETRTERKNADERIRRASTQKYVKELEVLRGETGKISAVNSLKKTVKYVRNMKRENEELKEKYKQLNEKDDGKYQNVFNLLAMQKLDTQFLYQKLAEKEREFLTFMKQNCNNNINGSFSSESSDDTPSCGTDQLFNPGSYINS